MADATPLPAPSGEPYVAVSLEPTFDDDGTAVPVLIGWIIVGPFHGQTDRLTISYADVSNPERIPTLLQEGRDFIAATRQRAAEAGLRFEAPDLEGDLQAWREEWMDEEDADPAP